MGIELLWFYFYFDMLLYSFRVRTSYKTRQNKTVSVTRIWQCAMAKQIIEHIVDGHTNRRIGPSCVHYVYGPFWLIRRFVWPPTICHVLRIVQHMLTIMSYNWNNEKQVRFSWIVHNTVLIYYVCMMFSFVLQMQIFMCTTNTHSRTFLTPSMILGTMMPIG